MIEVDFLVSVEVLQVLLFLWEEEVVHPLVLLDRDLHHDLVMIIVAGHQSLVARESSLLVP